MTINLTRGQTIDLEKGRYDLSAVTIGLGWDGRSRSGGGFLNSLFGGKKEDDYDLDVVAFLLDERDRIIDLGDPQMVGGDVIFFNNSRHPSGNLWLTGDNRTGAGDGDDEQLVVRLDALAPQYHKILFVVTIYQGIRKEQHFGMIENAFIRAVDARGREMVRYSLSDDAQLDGKQSLVFAEIARRDGGWTFRAIGDPEEAENFVDILLRHV